MRDEIRFVDEPDARFIDRRRKVWLACNGEPYDFRAVRLLRTRFLKNGAEAVSFIGPRCGEQHHSLLFG